MFHVKHLKFIFETYVTKITLLKLRCKRQSGTKKNKQENKNIND